VFVRGNPPNRITNWFSNQDSFQAASTKCCTQERTHEHNRTPRRAGRRDGTKLKRGFLVTVNK
jgi:hypothetical protein